MMMLFRLITRLVLGGFVLGALGVSHAATVSGELYKWHPVNIDFNGPFANERDDAPNPFLDYRLNVNLRSPSGQVTTVPGFFAGNGQGNGEGNVWRVRFSADEVGVWQYEAAMRRGNDVAISLDPNAGASLGLGGANGSFTIAPAPSSAPAFLRQGRLDYVGEHYLKHRDGPYWIKSGTDSPENLLAYAGFDGTVDQGGIDANYLHDFAAHRGDARESDPYFVNNETGVDSRGLTGALNYLGQQGVNSVYFLPMNLGGDGQDTFPFVSGSNDSYTKTHYDISKLHQWDIAFSHAQRQGIALHFVLSETEPENEQWLDGGNLGVERRLYFRELVARYAYLLGGKWNLGEEVDYPRVELDRHADYIQSLDWSRKPIAAHTHINQFFRYGEIVGDPRYSASSIQYDAQFASEFVERWRNNSRNAGHPWVLDMDENTNGLTNDSAESRRREILYDVYFSGGNIEWFFGSHPLPVGGDTTAGNFRQRENMWRSMRIARQFMENELPFWRMQPADDLVSNESGAYGGAEVFAARGEVYAIYLPEANGNAQLNLEGNGQFVQRWFNPETGGFEGGERSLQSGSAQSLGAPPSRNGRDWVVLVRSGNSNNNNNNGANVDNGVVSGGGETVEETPAPVETVTSPPSGTSAPSFGDLVMPAIVPGSFYSTTVTATSSSGNAPVITVGQLPPGMRIQSLGGGALQLEWQVPADFSGDARVELISFDALDSTLRTVLMVDLETASGPADDSPFEVSPEPVETVTNPQSSASAPAFVDLALPAIVPGSFYSTTVTATSSSGNAPVITVGQLPPGMRIQSLGGGALQLEWQVPADFSGDARVELISFDALDSTLRTVVFVDLASGMGPVANTPSSGTVDTGSDFPPIAAQSIQLGNTLSLRIAPRARNGLPPSLRVENSPAGAEFQDNGDGTRTFVWVPGSESLGELQLGFVADYGDVVLRQDVRVNISP